MKAGLEIQGLLAHEGVAPARGAKNHEIRGNTKWRVKGYLPWR